jgi:hypothetical protein
MENTTTQKEELNNFWKLYATFVKTILCNQN